MALLELIGVTKSFGGLVAVKDVSLKIQRGEIFGLIGPNGSGKTTTFNLICGFLKPTSGIIKYKGKEITGLAPYKICRMGVGRTFQVVKPFRSMTIYQNVMVGAIFGVKRRRKDVQQHCLKMLELVGLHEKRHISVASLTLAEKKRVELARSLAIEPELLMIDESVAGLNPVETEMCMELIRKIRDRGITIFIIEHVMKAIMGLCNRIAVLHHGQKIAEGTPTQIACDKQVIEAYLGGEAYT